MKFLPLIFIFLLSSCINKPEKDRFVLEGQLSFPNQTIPVYKMDTDLLDVVLADSIQTDAEGQFVLSMHVDEPVVAFIRLPNGTPMDVFLEPGVKLTVDQSDGTLKFVPGDGIYTFTRNMYSSYYQAEALDMAENEVTAFYDSLKNAHLKEINTYKQEISKALFDYTRYTILGLNFSFRLKRLTNLAADAPDFAFLDEITFADEAVLRAKEYVNMQINALPLIMERARKESNATNNYYFLFENIRNERYLKYARSMYLLFNYSQFSSESREQILTEFKTDYDALIPVPIRGMLQLLPGQKLFEFELKNKANESLFLSDYNDQLILIDFWATWCGPCIQEEPFLKELASAYPEELVVLSLSIDESRESWLEHTGKMQELHNIKHFHIENGMRSGLAQQFFLVGVPRYILIGRENKIIDAFAPAPSSEAMKRLLRENI